MRQAAPSAGDIEPGPGRQAGAASELAAANKGRAYGRRVGDPFASTSEHDGCARRRVRRVFRFRNGNEKMPWEDMWWKAGEPRQKRMANSRYAWPSVTYVTRPHQEGARRSPDAVVVILTAPVNAMPLR